MGGDSQSPNRDRRPPGPHRQHNPAAGRAATKVRARLLLFNAAAWCHAGNRWKSPSHSALYLCRSCLLEECLLCVPIINEVSTGQVASCT